MKKFHLMFCVAICACILQACGGQSKNDDKANADSANAQKDTSATSALAVSKDDAGFAVEAANGNMAEVELAKLALAKATDQQVKAFATKMITDHGKANDELKQIAKTENVTLPTVPGADEQKILGDLTKKEPKDFNKAYVDAMVNDHKEDVKKFTDAIKNVKDADLNAYATKTLPILQMHLGMITKIHDSLK